MPLFGLLILGLAWGGGPLCRMLATPACVLLGEASYALYILQLPVFGALHRLHFVDKPPAPSGRIAFILVSSLLAIAILKLFEDPARRALRRLGDRLAPPARGPAAPGLVPGSTGS